MGGVEGNLRGSTADLCRSGIIRSLEEEVRLQWVKGGGQTAGANRHTIAFVTNTRVK